MSGKVNAEHVAFGKEGFLHRPPKILDADPLLAGLFDRLVLHVGEIDQTLHLKPPIFQVLVQNVFKKIGSVIAQVLSAIHAGCADHGTYHVFSDLSDRI